MALKEGDSSKGIILKILVVIIIFVVIFVVLYFLVYKDYFLIFTEKCESKDCFDKHLVECKKASWINDAKEATWFYTIRGRSKGSCEVKVELKVVKEGKSDIGKAEGKSMLCYLPLNMMATPEKDLEKCTGPLKESLQDLIIKRMHSYILENLGEIKEELTKAI